jgi:MFS transporter, SET family, sugar efflux transporter
MPLLRGCTIWLAAGWLLFSLATDLTAALVVGALFLCFTGTVNAQLGGRISWHLWAYGIGIALVLSGDAMKLGYMPLLVVDHLGHRPVEFGVLMSASAVVELIAFPLAGALADKVGQAKVIAAALVVGAIDYSLLALTSSLWQLYVVQVLHVAVIVGMFGVGISYLQEISSRRPGLAGSTFFAAQGVATPLGGIAGGLSFGALGLPGMFWLPAVFCLLCGIGFAILTLRRKTCS